MRAHVLSQCMVPTLLGTCLNVHHPAYRLTLTFTKMDAASRDEQFRELICKHIQKNIHVCTLVLAILEAHVMQSHICKCTYNCCAGRHAAAYHWSPWRHRRCTTTPHSTPIHIPHPVHIPIHLTPIPRINLKHQWTTCLCNTMHSAYVRTRICLYLFI